MQIIFGEPPIYEEAKKLFNLDDKTTVFFSYGDCIYSPSGKAPNTELIRHEETHLEQQRHDRQLANIWWQRYFVDPAWRVEQEAEAYAAQYSLYCAQVKDRNKRFRYLHEVAKQLSSPMYGSAIKYAEAMKKVRSYTQGEPLKNIEDELE